MVEFHLDAAPPFIICPVDDPAAVEAELTPLDLTVGDGWWASDPNQKQPDGRWKLYVGSLTEYEERCGDL